jgi:hypothetical protein
MCYHIFFENSVKKKDNFFLLGTYAGFITTEKESYAIVNYFIYMHCHPTEKGFATSFNIPLTSRKRKDLPLWKDFLILIDVRVQPTILLKIYVVYSK